MHFLLRLHMRRFSYRAFDLVGTQRALIAYKRIAKSTIKTNSNGRFPISYSSRFSHRSEYNALIVEAVMQPFSWIYANVVTILLVVPIRIYSDLSIINADKPVQIFHNIFRNILHLTCAILKRNSFLFFNHVILN